MARRGAHQRDDACEASRPWTSGRWTRRTCLSRARWWRTARGRRRSSAPSGGGRRPSTTWATTRARPADSGSA
eukprot:7532242-Pyramimonas_sp.AAC.1